MSDCPQLFLPLMNMAWQLRTQPGFAELFQSSNGALAADTTTKLAPSGKSFDDIILIHLHGAMRVYCERQEKTWLDSEKARHKRTGLATVKFLAPLIRKLTRQEDKDFLARYPQRGLCTVLKPHLRHAAQFALIEALATLPTRTASILGDAVRGLSTEASIRNLAQLESAKCKFVTELARTFAETLIAESGNTSASAGGGPPAGTPPPVHASLGEIAGTALSRLAVDGLHLAKATLLVRDHARDITEKMGPSMSFDFWSVFADNDAAMNVARCPIALARTLGRDAARVHIKTSEALNSLKSPIMIEIIVPALVAAASRDALAQWAADEHCASGWHRLATGLNQRFDAGEITDDAVANYSRSLVPSFTALSAGQAEPPQVAPPTPPAAPGQFSAVGR